MEPVLCLLPSPLTGPASWHQVAHLLTSRGARVVEVPLPEGAPRTGEDVLAWCSAAIPGDEDVVLVPHSNAGLYVPALTMVPLAPMIMGSSAQLSVVSTHDHGGRSVSGTSLANQGEPGGRWPSPVPVLELVGVIADVLHADRDEPGRP